MNSFKDIVFKYGRHGKTEDMEELTNEIEGVKLVEDNRAC